MRIETLKRVYGNVAVLFLNTVLAGIVVWGAWTGFQRLKARARPPAPNPVQAKYAVPLTVVYPRWAAADIDALLGESWTRPFAFESFTHLKERPYAGRFVNVDAAGFRRVEDQAPWPPDPQRFNVFVFGGSTTFGYGLPDAETVPSVLQGLLRATRPDVAVYNFGRGHYFSSQERVLLEKLLVAGARPSAVVFIDGLNDFVFDEEPAFTGELARCVDAHWDAALGPQAAWRTRAQMPAAEPSVGPRDPVDQARRSLERYRRNKHLIEVVADASGIPAVFVWHPVPVFAYDLRHHLFASGLGDQSKVVTGYRLAAGTPDLRGERNFLWCAEVQEGLAEPLYVDAVHFTARLSRLVAERVAALVRERGLLDAGRPATSAPGPRGS